MHSHAAVMFMRMVTGGFFHSLVPAYPSILCGIGESYPYAAVATTVEIYNLYNILSHRVDRAFFFLCVPLWFTLKYNPAPTSSYALPLPTILHSPALPFLHSTDRSSLALQTGCGCSCAERGSGSGVQWGVALWLLKYIIYEISCC